MISRQTQAFTLVAAILLLLANVIAFNALFGRVRGVRADLTENKIYTLAPETIELIREPEEPLEIFFYHTALDRMHEKLRPLVGPLSDILREFEAASNGHVTTRIVEWDTADEATQNRATDQFGVKPVPIQMQTSDEATVRSTYFSVVVAYGDQHQRFDQGDLYRVVQVGAGLDIDVKLQNIEYLIAKAIYKVIRGFQSIGAALATNDITARIELYFSPKEALPKNLEKVPEQATKVAKKLADEAMGRLKYEVTTVKPDDEQLQTRLRREGIKPIRLDLFSETGVYSWVVITAGGKSVRKMLATLEGELSEFDIRDAIEGELKTLIPGFLTTVGVMSPDASKNPMAQMMGQRQPPPEFGEAIGALEGEFEIRKIDLNDGKPIPAQISVLLVIRPEALSDKAIFEIDQFVMRGGRLVVCADAFSFDLERAMQTRDVNSIKRIEFEGFRKFLRHLGADVGDAMIRDTKCETVQIPIQGKKGQIDFREFKFPYFIDIEPDQLDTAHDITAKQAFMLIEWATPVSVAKPEPGAEGKEPKPGVPQGVDAREIAWTSKASSLSSDKEAAQSQDQIAYKPGPDAKRHPFVVVLRGVFPSYFGGKPIPGDEAKEPESKGTDTAASRPENRERGVRLDRSKETSVVVIGDSDFINPFIAQAFEFTQAGAALRQNLTFLRNAIDFGGPEARLMAIRNRENVQRPLLGLRGSDEAQRAEKTGFSKMMAFCVPCALLIFLGVGWAIARHNRKPLALPTSRAAS